MIEINLLGKKKAFELPTVLGMNLNHINFNVLIIAYISTHLPDWFMKPHFDEIEKGIADQLAVKQKQLSKLKKEIKKNGNLEDQLDAFNKQIEKLKQRSVQVEKIIGEKTNPQKLLERVARAVPEDLWLTNLEINDKNEIAFEGFSNTYKSIGDFIQAANDTPFFGKSLILSKQEVEEKKDGEKEFRLEKFRIEGKIQAYEPFVKGM